MKKVHGGGDLPLIECLNPNGDSWAVRCCKQEDGENGYSYYEEVLDHEPSQEEYDAFVSVGEKHLTRQRMSEIKSELSSLDYLTSKYVDGEDMTEYGDWQGHRKALREEYRQLEEQLNG